MFIVKSYIKYPKKNIYDFNDVLARPSHYLVDMDNALEISRMQNKLNRFYTEGFIYLAYKEKIRNVFA